MDLRSLRRIFPKTTAGLKACTRLKKRTICLSPRFLIPGLSLKTYPLAGRTPLKMEVRIHVLECFQLISILISPNTQHFRYLIYRIFTFNFQTKLIQKANESNNSTTLINMITSILGKIVCPPESEVKPLTRARHLWYQWIPFYFWVVAPVFYLPYMVSHHPDLISISLLTFNFIFLE